MKCIDTGKTTKDRLSWSPGMTERGRERREKKVRRRKKTRRKDQSNHGQPQPDDRDNKRRTTIRNYTEYTVNVSWNNLSLGSNSIFITAEVYRHRITGTDATYQQLKYQHKMHARWRNTISQPTRTYLAEHQG